jgi:hypothetical protein
MSAAIKDGLYSKLTASTGAGTVYEAVGGRISANLGPHSDGKQSLVYTVVQDAPVNLMSGAIQHRLVFEFSIYGSLGLGASAIEATRDKLYTLLNRATFAVTGMGNATSFCVDRGTTSVEEDMIVVRSSYAVMARS